MVNKLHMWLICSRWVESSFILFQINSCFSKKLNFLQSITVNTLMVFGKISQRVIIKLSLQSNINTIVYSI